MILVTVHCPSVALIAGGRHGTRIAAARDSAAANTAIAASPLRRWCRSRCEGSFQVIVVLALVGIPKRLRSLVASERLVIVGQYLINRAETIPAFAILRIEFHGLAKCDYGFALPVSLFA